MDRRLQFNLHTVRTLSKGKRALGALNRMFGRAAGPDIFAKLIHVKIIPILLYGIAVAAPAGRTYLAELEKLCRFAARLVCNDYQSPYFDLLYQLHWNNVARTCFERRAMLAFKYVYSIRHLPGEFVRLAIATGRHSERTMQRAHGLQLSIAWFSKKTCDHFPIFELFRVWNALPVQSLV